MRLSDFCALPEAAGLQEAHVLALRLYTTAVFKNINGPLRRASPGAEPPAADVGVISTTTPAPSGPSPADGDAAAHPYPATVAFLSEGIKKLRKVDSSNRPLDGPLDLWRGMKNIKIDDFEAFARQGGTELGLMSTTSDAQVAVR